MNNNPKSNTRQYSTTTYSSRNKRNRKHGQSKFILFVLLALLIIALIVSIAIVVADLIGSGEEDVTSGIAGENSTQTPGTVDDDHSMKCAIDGKDETYLLSAWTQSEGSYFSCQLEAAAEIGTVRLVSIEEDYYIADCVLQLKIDGEWVTVAECGGGRKNSEYPVSETKEASAVRVLLTADGDTYFAINELSVKDKSGNAITLNAPSMGSNAGGDQGDVTDETTAPKPETTVKPDPGTTTITVSNDNMYVGELILVNSQYAYRFPSSQASLLNVYNEYYANDLHCNYFMDSSIQLEAAATIKLLAMANALFTEKGINNLQIGTGYRSYETQQDLANRYPATAALPGYSEHHTGLGVDLQVWDKDKKVIYTFDDTNQICTAILAWMNENAYKYGFVRRFAPNKDAITQITSDRWHYRYVGVPHAYYMTQNDLCLEEYLAALEKCTYGGNHLFVDVDGKSYEIYYVPAVNGATTTIPVPGDPSIYTVSGNNYSGFIVTIER
jgi:D-alanyl-D-alanine carboxypeptidase